MAATKVLAVGENSLALRLTSELVDLRAANANLIRRVRDPSLRIPIVSSSNEVKDLDGDALLKNDSGGRGDLLEDDTDTQREL